MKQKKYALIIVDMQKDFVLPGAPVCVAGAYETIPKIREALDLFREIRWPVFHVFREYRADGSDIENIRLKGFLEEERYAVPGTEGCEIVDELKPVAGEYRIVKNRFSAFMNTEVDFMLRRLDVRHIVVCGTQYPNCIRTTVFDGVSFGYHVTLLTDATSAQTPEIAEANKQDIANIGVECITLDEFKAKIA
ncbi:isochorismatase family cysteine hydrolase [Desulfobacterales bacterium HSG2]|nr:isochorismatase family cysteine hydrolase [Desulfobacterales bacterium HSG2]